MKVITEERICDRCKKKVEFHFMNTMFPGYNDVIKIQKRYGITSYREDWRDADLCIKCQEDCEKFWLMGKESEEK